MWSIIWLAVFVVLIVFEAVTTGLFTIWFAGGALAALLSGLTGISVAGQVVLFFTVSFLLLFLTRPFALKYIKPHNIKTNYEELIGKNVQVTTRIDNRNNTGTVLCNGLEWTARSTDDQVVFESGETANVAAIKGVKLFVTKNKI